jgi:glycosyltransferase involved in cell wall biosynthesis
MPRFARLLVEGMQRRGHTVEEWTAAPIFFRIPLPGGFRKWLGYLDQYVVFPITVRWRLANFRGSQLFVFADQALGPWVPLVANRLHVIHCHDFLAQRSALGEIPENPTGFSGRLYQAFIRRGYRRGRHFISVSEKTRQDLGQFLRQQPATSEVVYNGLSPRFTPCEVAGPRKALMETYQVELTEGYLLHVGGNQWYKNRRGVIELYLAWRRLGGCLPCIMIGQAPTAELLALQADSEFGASIHWWVDAGDETVTQAYAGASLFLFPSLAEGFGWPIAEAMASGCPVITTDEAPMTEVAGDVATLIPRRPFSREAVEDWAKQGAKAIDHVLAMTESERAVLVAKGVANGKRFIADEALDRIEAIYLKVASAD